MSRTRHRPKTDFPKRIFETLEHVLERTGKKSNDIKFKRMRLRRKGAK